MKTILFYYTGAGNSLWVTRQLAKVIGGNTEIIPLKKMVDQKIQVDADAIGIIFPVHIWGLPEPIISFVNRLAVDGSKYYFALGLNKGQVSRTFIQLQKLMKKRGLTLNAAYSILMPSIYTPWGGPEPIEEQNRRFEAAKKKVVEIAGKIGKNHPPHIDKGPLWHRIYYTSIYKMSYNYIPTMDKKFWTDEKCKSCGTCTKVCSAHNIELVNGKPKWNHRCEQCFACLQWCPQKAIQHGKNTPKYERFHHPEILVSDIIDGIKS